jgi:hypothetical protein
MSYKIRRYTIALCILLILSVFHFALAAPVPVGEILEVRSNVDILEDGMAAWEKRMDSGDEDLNLGSDSDSDTGVSDAPGSHDEEDMVSDAPNEGSEDDDVVVNSDANDYYVDDGDDGYHAGGDEENENDDVQSGEDSSVENTNPGPESEHPATPGPMADLEELPDELRFRPRNTGSGAVGTPKGDLQGTADTKAYVSGSSLPLQAT